MRELEIFIWQALRDIANIALLPISSISLTQFYGIELDEYACDTATLSLWLAEHQMNVKFRDAFGVQPETLPLKPSGNIVCGNACRIDWNIVCPHKPDEEVYIMGNPPYLGSSLQDAGQKDDLKIVCSHFENYKNLDYIASWFYKASEYIDGTNASVTFVSTNSICQGDNVSLLWPNIFAHNVNISFAYQSFRWSNNAKFNAAVTVVVIGLSANMACYHRLFYNNTVRVCDSINAYLLAGPNIIISRMSEPISNVPNMIRGSMPSDGGGLILSESEYKKLYLVNPLDPSILKRYIGAEDFIDDSVKRFCIWCSKEQYEILRSIPEFFSRFKIVQESRLKSNTPTTRKYAQYPYLFRQPQYHPSDSIIIPIHSSERREYIPIGFVDKNTIISNAAFAIYDAEKWLFALLTSKMHNLWVRSVGGALETRIRYSNTLCYNTFPFPKLTTAEKEELEQLAQNILNIRDQNFDLTLGEMYNPETMPDELREAHHQLDLAVERIYRPEPFTSDEERLEHLFKLYTKMIKE